MDLVLECYRSTEKFPRAEAFGLASQLQKASVSVPANIAEGHGRHTTKDYLHHLAIAYGSLMELETHIQIAVSLSYIDISSSKALFAGTEEVGRMLNGLMTALRKKRIQSLAPDPWPPAPDPEHVS
jgi:four helix bundle protein